MAPLPTLHEEALGQATSLSPGDLQDRRRPASREQRRAAGSGGSASSTRAASGSGRAKKSAGGASSKKKSGRDSSVKRRFVRAEVEAKFKSEKEVWHLQQQLLSPGATQELMGAAKQLLQERCYKAVVEERSVEGLCGFPPCSKDALGKKAKKWAINNKTQEVYDQAELGAFCSLECFRNNGVFEKTLDPDPAYCRPASAVAAARGAVASATDDPRRRREERQDEGAALSAPSESAPSKPPSAVPPGASTATAEGEGAAAATGARGASDGAAVSPVAESSAPIPKVRPRAVVRFSREKQTYSVRYEDYDGGGELPLPSAAAASQCAGSAGSSAMGRELAAESSAEGGGGAVARESAAKSSQDLVRQLLATPVVERGAQAVDCTTPAGAGEQEAVSSTVASTSSVPLVAATSAAASVCADIAEPCAGGAAGARAASPRGGGEDASDVIGGGSGRGRGASGGGRASDAGAGGGGGGRGKVRFDVEDAEPNEADEVCEDTDAFSDGSSGDEHFDADAVVHAPAAIPFVRAWGVLATWLTDQARLVLHRGEHLERDEEGRPAHRGRRALLRDLIGSRLPGDLSFLSSRLEDLTFALGVHQALPSVAEPKLYDFLGALLIRALLRAEVKLGAVSPSATADATATRGLEVAAKRFGITDEELEALVAVVDRLPSA